MAGKYIGAQLEFPVIDSSKSEIRVLEIKPGEWESPVECSYHIINLNQQTLPYETLSYAWGSSNTDDMCLIIIENVQAKVSPVLLSAIQHIRYTDKSRYIWIDALCINQSDNEEKTQQVDMMNPIYTKCDQCTVWLGLLDEVEPSTAKAVFEFINWAAGNQEEPSWVSDPDRSNAIAKAITVFMHLPWWYRIWTVQEIILPPKATLLWGHLSITREALHKAADNIVDSEMYYPQELDRYGGVSHFTSSVRGLGFSQNEDLLRLCMRWRIRYATDPRDKVYALMAFRRDESLISVPSCDYTIDVRTLYKRTTADLIRNQGSLLPLIGRRGEISDLAREQEGFPSWAISWTKPVDPENDHIDFWTHLNFWLNDYEPSAEKGLHGVEDGVKMIGDDVICLYGLPVDKVVVVESFKSDRSEAYADDAFTYMFNIVKRWEEVVEVFQAERPGVLRHGWIRDLFGFAAGSVERDAPATGYDMEEFHRDMVQQLCFFITERGIFGLGPKNTHPGHEVWVVGGSRFPFLLDPIESPNGVSGDEVDFNFVADCLVYGIMNGEAVEGREEQQVEIRLH